jgi:Zn-finger in ubiquitin-hydrolases and other protein
MTCPKTSHLGKLTRPASDMLPCHKSVRRPGSQEVSPMSDPHLKEIRKVTPHSNGCEECLKIGSEWVHLRLCLTCGHVGCCDDSPNRHATAHFHATRHPIIQSFEPGEDWRWCYVHEAVV